MKKRISCFLLALVMVLLAIPVFALSALAVETPYSTSWKANYPSYGAAADGYPVKYTGAWVIGSAPHNDPNSFVAFSAYTTDDTTNKLIRRPGEGQWAFGGYYLGYHQMITPQAYMTQVRYYAEYTGTVTLDVLALQFNHGAGQSGAFAVAINGTVVWPEADGISLSSTEKWLNADTWSSDDLTTKVADLEAREFDVIKGDHIDFITSTYGSSNKSSWGANAFDAQVTYTSIVDTAEGYNSFSTGYWRDNSVAPTQGNPAAFSGDAADADAKAAYLEYMLQQNYIHQPGNWQIGIVSPSTLKFEPISRVFTMADTKFPADGNNLTWGVTEAHYQHWVNGWINSGWAAGIWQSNSGALSIQPGAGYSDFQPGDTNTLYAFSYTAPVSGEVSFSYDLVCTPKAGQTMYLAILVDGYMVWPTAGGSLTDTSKFYAVAGAASGNSAAITAAANAALADVSTFVEEGSRIEFVARKSAWASSHDTGAGFRLRPAVTMTEVVPPVVVVYKDDAGKVVAQYECKEGDAFPVPTSVVATWDIDGDGVADELPATVSESVEINAVLYLGADKFTDSIDNTNHVFKENWVFTYGMWNKTGTASDRVWIKANEIGTWNAPHYTFPSVNDLWGGDGAGHGGMYPDGKIVLKNETNGAAVVYTAPATGLVDLDFNKLIARRETNDTQKDASYDGTISLCLSILKNGEVIWPTDASAFVYESTRVYTATAINFNYNLDLLNATVSTDVQTAVEGTSTAVDGMILKAAPEFPTALHLNAGDELAFVVSTANTNSSWFGYIDPVVTYTELIEGPEAMDAASVTLNEKFAVNLFVDIASAPVGATELGMIINGKRVAIDGEGMATLAGIAAKDLADEITYAPVCTYKGVEMRGAESTVTVAALLKQYLNSELPGYSAENAGIAAATLNYAAAAQKYFEPETADEDLANYGVDVEVAVNGDYSSALAIQGTTANNVATPYSATLLLNDDVSIKFIYVNAVADFAENYEFALLDGEGNVTATRFTPVLCDGQTNTYKLILDGVMPNAWNTEYTVAVVAKGGSEVVGETVTYSVISYLARMQGDARVGDVVNAMLALYEATV